VDGLPVSEHRPMGWMERLEDAPDDVIYRRRPEPTTPGSVLLPALTPRSHVFFQLHASCLPPPPRERPHAHWSRAAEPEARELPSSRTARPGTRRLRIRAGPLDVSASGQNHCQDRRDSRARDPPNSPLSKLGRSGDLIPHDTQVSSLDWRISHSAAGDRACSGLIRSQGPWARPTPHPRSCVRPTGRPLPTRFGGVWRPADSFLGTDCRRIPPLDQSTHDRVSNKTFRNQEIPLPTASGSKRKTHHAFKRTALTHRRKGGPFEGSRT
jgi:hypothetical protein